MKTISSSSTFFYKYISPLIGILIVAFGIYYLFIYKAKADFVIYFVFFGWFIILIISQFLWGSAKKIDIDGSNLIISNYFKNDCVDLSDVKSISASYLIHPELIWIDFHKETKFGNKVKFIPPFRFFPLYENKLAKELKELVFKRKTELNKANPVDEKKRTTD